MCDTTRQGLAVGFFDGVHLGHRAILSGARRVLTFRNHPLTVLAPDRAPRLILTLEERLAAIRECGVEEVMALDFTPELAALSPEDFAARYLSATEPIYCGANWHFGEKGRGDAAWLHECGFEVRCPQFALYDGEPISSTRIRAALASGEIGDANAMLGRPFELRGETFRGKGEGTRLGFPTVNVRVVGRSEDHVELPRGVYEVDVAGIRAIANFGRAPTMGERAWRENVLEVHFVGGVTGACAMPSNAGVSLSVGLLRFIRPERTFESLESLKAQIAEDVSGFML